MARGSAYRRRKPARPRRRRAAQGYLGFVADAGVFFLTVLIGLAALIAYFARDLPDTSALWRENDAPRITLLAADGSPIAAHGANAGAPVRLAELPVYVPQTVLAVEDRNFYHHFGANPVSLLRALIVNARSGAVVQGGSTITQQLAKNLFLTPERTLKRKIQELIFALWLERRFTKDEILTLYLNRVYFGAGAYGVDAASYRYYGKSARHLTLGEAAVLAGLLKAPSRFSPTSSPEDAGKRARFVINRMAAAGYITEAEAAAVVARPIRLAAPRQSSAPYFVDYVLREARAIAGDIDADLVVRTTFDPAKQEAADLGLLAGWALALRHGLSPDLEVPAGEGWDGADAQMQAASVILAGDGAVLAMIGGRDYQDSQFNRAVQAKRQPGSAFKPFVYLAALESGAQPYDIILDAPLRIGAWRPDNYKGKFYGEVTLEEALARSLNGATIRVQETIGRPAVRRMARAMGFDAPLTSGPAVALGVDAVSPMDLAGAYAPFANGGFRVAPYAIASIETAEGDVIYRRAGSYLDQAASRASIEKANAMLRSVVAFGTGGAAAVPGYPVAGKTGTSQANRDAWFAGHAGGLVCVVWVGRDDNGPMPGVTGGRMPAQIWREIMARALPPRYVAPATAPGDDPIAAILRAQG
jgi:penicillin-binding protein 1A